MTYRVINAVFIGVGLMLSALIIQGVVRQPQPVRAADAPNQRFVPALQPEGFVTGVWAKDFALDTKTGQLCRTRGVPVSRFGDPLAVPVDGGYITPACLDLYKKF